MPKRPMTKKAASKTDKAAKAKPAPKQAPKPKKAASPPPPPAKGKAGKGPAEAPPGYDVVLALIDSFATSNRITRFLLENLHDDVWHAAPVGGRGRSVAAIACHMHNARVMWLASFGR